MERLVQYLDDLDDLIFAIALKAERIRMAISFFLFVVTAATLQVACVLIALRHPPIALAIAALLTVSVLFDAVVGQSPRAYTKKSSIRAA